jgi:hypothetical protein
MGRKLDSGLDKRTETQRGKDSGSKTPKMDKIKSDTKKKLSDNFNKKR